MWWTKKEEYNFRRIKTKYDFQLTQMWTRTKTKATS